MYIHAHISRPGARTTFAFRPHIATDDPEAWYGMLSVCYAAAV